jgi:DNA-binding transcriptional LysR family regulator
MTMGDQWQFSGPEGTVAVKIQPRLWSNNGDTCIAAAVHGLGIQLQPTFLVGQELATGQLVEVLPHYRAAELGIHAVYPSRKFVLPKVRALIEFLTVKLAAASW